MKITIIETPTHQGIYFGNDLARVGEDTDRLDIHPIRELHAALGHETEVVKGKLDGFPAFLPDALRVLDVDAAQPVNDAPWFGYDTGEDDTEDLSDSDYPADEFPDWVDGQFVDVEAARQG